MYFYIYDSYLQEAKYQPALSRIESRLLELGINGRIEKLTILKNLKEMVDDGMRRGAKTMIAVGNDNILCKVISYLAPYKKVTFGFIPVGPGQKIAHLLGIPDGEQACDVLSKRILQKFDLGKVNDQYFLFYLDVASQNVTIECDDNYRINTTDPEAKIKICNLGLIKEERFFNPGDGLLEAVVMAKKPSWQIFKKEFREDSIFPIKKAKIKCETECASLLIDGLQVVKTPANVEVVPGRLNVIVGRERKF